MIKNSTILIEAKQICHDYGDKSVLNEVSFALHQNEIITLIGPNGAGKSTLLKILLKLIRPSSGQVVRKAGLKIGFMPQKIHIDPTLPMTVLRFLQLGTKKSNRSTLEHLKQITNELNIEKLLNQPIQKVSGGEMQRILLARALMSNPQLLVLDEPVQGVDIQGQTELYHYINDIRNRYQCGILMVSHDLHIVMKNTDKVICLNQHVCCSGSPQAVNSNPAFLEIFGPETAEIAIYEHHHDEKTCQHTHGTDTHSNKHSK